MINLALFYHKKRTEYAEKSYDFLHFAKENGTIKDDHVLRLYLQLDITSQILWRKDI